MPATPEELLAALAESPNHPYPKALIEEMIQRREEMIPALLALVEDAGRCPENYIGDHPWKHLVFAAHLLAQFRETRAFQPLCATLGPPAQVADDLWGDMITENMGRILASVYDGNDAPLRALVADPATYEYVRGSTVPHAYLCLVQSGTIRREELETYTEDVLSRILEREPSFAWDGWTGLCADLGFARLVPLIKQAYADGLCDPFFYGLDALIRNAESGLDHFWRTRASLIDDTIKETNWWSCWSQPESPKANGPKSSPKIGRNDPCVCGSGKKYKKCCGTADNGN